MPRLPFSFGLYLLLTASAVLLVGTVRQAFAHPGAQRFVSSSLGAPVPVNPANMSVLGSAAADSLAWNTVSGAVSYRLQVSTGSSFSVKDSIAVDSVVSTDKFVLTGMKSRVYYWRVLAANTTDTSAWSAVWSFDNGVPPSPVVISPQSQSSDRPSPLTLRWSSAYNRTSRVQLAVYRGDFAFSSGDIIVDTTLSQDSIIVGGLSLGQTYYWRVDAQNMNGTGPWTGVSTFSTSSPPSVSILQPGYGAQLNPAGITCSWLPTGGAINYEIQVSTDPYFNAAPIVDTTTQATSLKLETLSYGGSYYWRLRAESNVGDYWGTWTTSVFYTLPAATVLSRPSDHGMTYAVGPVFRWKEIVGATYYRIQIAYDSNFVSLVLDSTSSAPVDSVKTDSLKADTTFFWHVRGGSNNNGWGNYSPTWTFKTSALPPKLPSAYSPPDSSTILPLYVILSWASVPGADMYLLQLSADSNFAKLQIDDSSIVSDSLVVDSLKTVTTYYWRVKAGSKTAGWGNFSPRRVFTTAPYILPSPEPSLPSDSTNNQPTTIELHWQKVPHALIYQVQVSPDSSMDTLVLNDTAVVADSVLLGPLVRGFRYFWHVRAGRGAKSWGPYSRLWEFYVESWTQAGTLRVDTTMNYPRYNNVSEFKTTDYKLMGLPGFSDIGMVDLLGGTPGKDWQAYTDNGDTSNYLVKYSSTSQFTFGLGNGFWIIHNGPMKIDTTLKAAPLDSIGHVKVFLHPGWNIITDPFMVDVPWDSIQALNRKISNPIWGYNTSFNTSTTLVPFSGYYFFNSDSLRYILVPYMEPQGSRTAPGRLMKTSSADSDWTVRVTLTADGVVDSSAWFGVSSLAKAGFNRFDVRMPLGPGFEPAVYFHHPEWDRSFSSFASDVRPVFADSSNWHPTVAAAPGKPATLDFSGFVHLPGSFAAYLYDPSSAVWTNIEETGRYNFVPKSETTSFTLLVGKKDLVDAVVRASTPVSFQLENNYPNPFNPTTVIGYTLPARSHVTLDIYNVLGQRVVTLIDGEQAAGQHITRFDGSKFASGVYFYRLIAGNHVSTKKMMLLK